MRRLPVILLLLATAFAASAAGLAPQREIDHVTAFARLYGVVRYFYPSDAAAALDWNRYAVHGVSQVRAASDLKRLETTLQTLVRPLGPGIVIASRLPPAPAAGSSDGALIAWRYFGAAVTAAGPQSVYKAKRTNRPLQMSQGGDGFATVMQNVPALPLRGKTVRLRGLVRAETSSDAATGAALWLRIDRAGGQMGFFDNMGNRPVRDSEWRQYEIEGQVADDATNVAFGAMASAGITAEFESIGLSVRDGSGAWTLVDIKDPGFEDSPDSAGGWFRAGTSKSAVITRPTDKAPEGRQFLRIAAPAATASTAEIFEAPPPATGAHADVDLGAGLHARVPLALSEAQATGGMTDASQLEALRKALAAVAPSTSDRLEVNVRLADVVVAWNVFRHFYPYWNEAQVDWDSRLKPQLGLAYDATTRDAHRDALRLLVADLRDGHGGVVDPQGAGARALLPIQLQVVEERVAITASGTDDAPVGAVVASIDGVAADRRLSDAVRLTSGTPQWRERRALQEIITCTPGSTVTLAVDSGAGQRSASLPCAVQQPAAERRPAAVGELVPGVWYVDLTRAPMGQITPVLKQLTSATGVVFDLRGYPTDAGFQILPYLLAAPEADRWMHVDKIVGPFGKSAGSQSMGWDHKPASPHLSGKLVFLTDGRAISYAESVMGYVADRKLGTIVGATTAGANGNVAVFVVPGGYRISFTGMRVTGHDGKTPHHLAGVKPDVAASPTLAGLRQGRDEVLERALALIRGQ
jgi:Peptidase family S41